VSVGGLPTEEVCHRITTMTTIKELQVLADGLTKLMPPPALPPNVQTVKSGTGRWAIVPIGSGSYALRIEYKDKDNNTITVRAEREITGFPSSLKQSLEFMLSVHSATRHRWLPV
jgi:hypothetical protein